MSIERIDRSKGIREQVFQQLKEQLVSGEWTPGSKLPSEDKMADSFGVSKVTVRQALQQLTALGLIETRPGDGTYVCKRSAEDLMSGLIPVAYLDCNIFEVLQFRRAIETETAAIAASCSTKEDIAYLEETIEILQNNAQDTQRRAEAEINFHYRIARMTKNTLIIRSYDLLMDIFRTNIMENLIKLGSEGALYYHPLIKNAIEAHDSVQAAALMREHLTGNVLRAQIETSDETIAERTEERK